MEIKIATELLRPKSICDGFATEKNSLETKDFFAKHNFSNKFATSFSTTKLCKKLATVLQRHVFATELKKRHHLAICSNFWSNYYAIYKNPRTNIFNTQSKPTLITI